MIGQGIDREALTAMFDEATLTDAEMARGPARWATMRDPVPAWDDDEGSDLSRPVD